MNTVPGLGEFAALGERGVDIFRRVEEQNQRRYRYECIATILSDTGDVTAYVPFAENHPERMRAAARRFAETPLMSHGFALGTPHAYPPFGISDDPLDVFLYLDFCRLWQLAEQEIARLSNLLDSGAVPRPAETANVLRLLLDFNRLSRATPIIRHVLPSLMEAVANQSDDTWQNAAYSLRMVGDLQFRAGQPHDALAAYEASLALGVNPHRTGLAIRAAHAARNAEALQRHLAQFEARWPLPKSLAKLKPHTLPTPEGDPA